MSFYLPQFKQLIYDTLKDHGLFSVSAVNLLLGTCAQESHFGRYLRQRGTGPALGVFQIEPNTYNWLREKYGKKYNFTNIPAKNLIHDLKLSILVCRLKYYSIPEPLPNYWDISALAGYWKKYYNSFLGSGKVSEFVENYNKYVS